LCDASPLNTSYPLQGAFVLFAYIGAVQKPEYGDIFTHPRAPANSRNQQKCASYLPIRYNNDKGGKPHGIRDFEKSMVVFSLFSQRKGNGFHSTDGEVMH
jgi:hypothetical protein